MRNIMTRRRLVAASSLMSTLVLVLVVVESAFSLYTARWGVFDARTDGSAYIVAGVSDAAMQQKQDPATLSVDDYDRSPTTKLDAYGNTVCDASKWAGYVLMYQDRCDYRATAFYSDPTGAIHTSKNTVYSPGHWGNGEFIVRARGTACDVGAPRLVATMWDGTADRVVLDVAITAVNNYGTYRAALPVTFKGETQTVKLKLSNPRARTSTCERTVYVDYAGFRPRTRATVNPAVAGSTVADASATNGTGRSTLIDSGTTSTPVSSTTSVYVGWQQYQLMALRVRSGGTCGGAAPRVKVAFRGYQYIDATVSGTSFPASYDKLLVGDMSAALWSGAVSSDVTVTLANPYRDGTCSRRIYVDYVSVVPKQSVLEGWAANGRVS